MTGRQDTSRILLFVLVGVIALAALISIFGQGSWQGWGPWGWSMMGLMGLWMFVPLLFVAWLVSVFVQQSRPPVTEDALEVARRRYAAGDITREEFEQIRDDLRRGPQ